MHDLETATEELIADSIKDYGGKLAMPDMPTIKHRSVWDDDEDEDELR